MTVSAKVVLDSIHSKSESPRITTMILRFPRFILPELNTHRVLSKNSSSSRAVPVRKIIEDVQTDPAMPVEWGTHKPGMQAGEPLSEDDAFVARQIWLDACDQAVVTAQRLLKLNLAKQVINRILEPFSHTSVIVTATEWKNFFDLRCHPDADPTMRELAEAMRDAYKSSESVERRFHVPLVPDFDQRQDDEPLRKLMFISAARCARVSYLNHDQSEPDEERDLELACTLAESRHMSPFEHQAIAMEGASKGNRNFVGWYQHRALVEGN